MAQIARAGSRWLPKCSKRRQDRSKSAQERSKTAPRSGLRAPEGGAEMGDPPILQSMASNMIPRSLP
eukprot:3260264-Pyramimonas_sp.AAC.1